MTQLSEHELDPNQDLTTFLAPGVTADLNTCDREPIHLSGAIQPHGLLLALDAAELTVQQASANAGAAFGVEATHLFGRPLSHWLGEAVGQQLREAMTGRRVSVDLEPVRVDLAQGRPFELICHRMNDSLIVELEPVPGTEGPMGPTFWEAHHALDAVHTAAGVADLCRAAVAQIRRLTGYDRVMAYRFHPDWHGEVVAEEHVPGLQPWLGLHYPATDIPRQARKLYQLNHLRVIADVDYQPVPLMAPAGSDPTVLDLSMTGLRSVSPIHLAYLRNMGVAATLTISLMRGTHLWGMIACHHHAPKLIGARLRATCRMLGQAIGLQVSALEELENQAQRTLLRGVERQIVARMADATSLVDGLISQEPDPLAVASADGLVARIDGMTVSVGSVPADDAIDVLLTKLRSAGGTAELISDELPAYLGSSDIAAHSAGVLALPLSAGYEDFLMWFRGEWVHTVTWAGRPESATVGAPHAQGATGPDHPADLTGVHPRASFAAWTQQVHGRSRPWFTAEIDTARTLARAIPDLQLIRARSDVAHLAELSRRETSARLAVEVALRENENRLEELASSTAVGFFVCTVDPTEFVYVNSGLQQVLGLEPDARPPTFAQVIAALHPADRARTAAEFCTPGAGRAEQVDARLTLPNGDLRWIRVTSNSVPVDPGVPPRTAGTVEDITAHKVAEEAVRTSQREAVLANTAKSEFMSRMSHELRTPLNAVLGFAQLLELDPLSEAQDSAVGHILRGGQHLLELVNDVMDISRIETDQLDVALVALSITDILIETAGLVRPIADRHQIEIVIGAADGIDHQVLADPRRLRQVLLNLLSNAIKYNRPGGHVTVTYTVTEADPEHLLVTVSDTGQGIRPDDLSRLFTPFDRLGQQTSEIEGTGIGLALTKRLLTLMGGQLEVRSEWGHGSDFTVILPRIQGPRPIDEVEPPPPAEPPGAVSTSALLYIEDNASNVHLVSRIVARRPGWTMEHAGSGTAGIERAEIAMPDLIFLDLHLPDMDGIDVLAALTADPRTTDIPVVILSADASKDQRTRIDNSPARGFLTKPLDVRQVLELLDTYARG